MGPRRAEALAEAGVHTIGDLLEHLPFRWEDRRRFARVADLAADGPPVTLQVEVVSSRLARPRRRFSVLHLEVRDDSGSIRATFFNQPYLAKLLQPGRRIVLFGRASVQGQKLVLAAPELEVLDEEEGGSVHTGRIVPVYRKLAGMTVRPLRALMHRTLAETDLATVPARLDEDLRTRYQLLPRGEALSAVHFPPDDVDVEDLSGQRTAAQRTLAFEEAYLLQLALAVRRAGWRDEKRGIAYALDRPFRKELRELLPFRLTRAQKRVLEEIGDDLRAPRPMNRLLQGDVGSGKTIVALLTLLVAVHNGFQGALMAPTEILAVQHRQTIEKLFARARMPQPPTVTLTGSLRAAERRTALEAIASGEARLIVGTHALFVESVAFRALGIVVVDEQHRFGVTQRASLAQKGVCPDVLVMTATPIPRTLSLTLYGDLDVSVIDERPPGRQPIRTRVRTELERERVWRALEQALRTGRQAYVVTPLADESETSDLKDAVAFAEEMRRRFPRHRVGHLHGKMKAADKDATMAQFVAGALDVLVSTTVIEVGVDVPNATVMIVEHAERFGLSQLHQLRGRVGRGGGTSYCVLMVSGEGPETKKAAQRLAIMEATDDGFRIAGKDLELRGPGAIFGTQQHGLSDLQFLEVIVRQPELLDSARREAQRRVQTAAGRAEAIDRLTALGGRWQERLGLAGVG